ncbi:hypothetical protein HK104_000529 [Borealophlyctis nickersoniae]|nr:hypothetical protein HK104_000529 [Borealophlyctis nickersoniae]
MSLTVPGIRNGKELSAGTLEELEATGEVAESQELRAPAFFGRGVFLGVDDEDEGDDDAGVGAALFARAAETTVAIPPSRAPLQSELNAGGSVSVPRLLTPSDPSVIPTIFIDRHPDVFAVILSYLRTNEVHYTRTATVTKQAIATDAAYYALPELLEKLKGSATTHYAYLMFKNSVNAMQFSDHPMELDESMVDTQVERFSALSCLNREAWGKVLRFIEQKDSVERRGRSGFRWQFLGIQASTDGERPDVVGFFKRELA